MIRRYTREKMGHDKASQEVVSREKEKYKKLLSRKEKLLNTLQQLR